MIVERTSWGNIAPSEHRRAICVVLHQMGGAASSSEVIQRIEEILPISEGDRVQEGPNSRIRFKDRIHKERWRLLLDGLLESKEIAGHGRWQFTPEGSRQAKALIRGESGT